ncbi:alpha-L-rhamnosidase-related protein [Robiginitalea sp. IMCC44478]|uniref:alpha-L-rhamnosidase-related protein n=1 Tax=Robiginitalea sp. IMCC44478 TaxID=3459122 RepID=UPI0040424086
MKMRLLPLLGLSFLINCSCTTRETSAPTSFANLLSESPSITGKEFYLPSPYVTAGDRVYMVGHQDGSFPDLGWHIKGEMGGIWDHPIKLMDGFEVSLEINNTTHPLKRASSFTNFPMANRHIYELDSVNLKIDRWQFVPDGKEGLLLEFVIENKGTRPVPLNFIFRGRTDLRPTWLGERTGMINGRDLPAKDEVLQAWIVKDSLNPWFVIFGSDQPAGNPESSSDKNNYQYMDKLGNPETDLSSESGLTYPLEIAPGEAKLLRFAIAGSYRSEAEARQTYSDLLQNATALLTKKRDRYVQLASMSRLKTPDSALNQTFEWLKYNSDWLIQTVPEIGTGIVAGIPDYPWWFGVDSEYALKGYMAIGRSEIVEKTIRLLDSVSNAINGNGRILHEMSTNGAVFNPGNINETPQFASLVWDIYRWNGDAAFLQKYYGTITKGLNWLVEEKDKNGNGFPDGFGMMEIHGLDSEMIDVASYTQAAFADASSIAQVLGDIEKAEAYARVADRLKVKINREFWSEDFNSYADFIGTDQQALRLIADAIVRADTLNKPWAVAELEATRAKVLQNRNDRLKPFVLHHNWVVNTPMEMGIADPDKALKALETAHNFVNPFGMFVTGIDRDASAGTDEGSFKGSKVFSYTGAVMTLPTGVQAIAENNYGRPDRALDYLQRMCRSFSYALPGSMYEVSPDYGMIAQAWNIYSFAIPVVEQFFGIDPMAAEKRIRISPLMPSEWGEASLENVRIAGNSISVYYQRQKDGRLHLKVTQSQNDWTLEVPVEAQAEKTIEIISGKLLTDEQGEAHIISQDGVLEFKVSKLSR